MADNKIPEGWQTKTIIDIGSVVTGSTPNTQNAKYWGGSIPFISPADFEGSVYVERTARTLSIEGAEKARMLPKDAILVTCIGSLGGIAMSARPSVTNQQINAVVAKDDQDSRFHFYNILFNIHELTRNAGTTTLPIINKSVFSQINLLFPPLPEQQKIAAILTSVDTVIEKTRAQIDKLKHLKTGMMQQLLTQGIGHTEFKDSPVGRIPKTWVITQISEVCSDIVDCVNKTAPVVDQVTPYRMIRTTNVRDGSIIMDGMRYVTEETYETWSRRISLRDGDIIFTREAPVGECGILKSSKNLFLGQRTMVYRADESKINNLFLLVTMQSEYFKSQIDDLSGGSTTPHLRVPDCSKILLKIPLIEEQEKIANILQSIDTNIMTANRKLTSLEKTKKALMQDLLTGKKRTHAF